VRRHLVGLRRLPRHYVETYRTLARAGLSLYRAGSSKKTQRLRRLLGK